MKKCAFVKTIICVYISICTHAQSVNFDFYSNHISIPHHNGSVINTSSKISERKANELFSEMETKFPQTFIGYLSAIKEKLRLNDWLYYKFVKAASETIFPKESNDFRIFFQWYLLTKSGYDIKLVQEKNLNLYVHVPFEEDLINTIIIGVGKYKYACLTEWPANDYNVKNYSEPKYRINKNPKGKLFSFFLREIPVLENSSIIKKPIKFYYGQGEQIIDVEVNQTYTQLLSDYPKVSLFQVYQIPFSKECKKTFVQSLQKLLEGKSEKEQAELILWFVSRYTEYKADEKVYGRERWLASEECLLASYMDCDDYSSFLWGIYKEVLRCPMVIIQYDHAVDYNENHVNIGISLKNTIGETIEYKSMKFSICEPTGPHVSAKVGDNSGSKGSMRIKYKTRVTGMYLPDVNTLN